MFWSVFGLYGALVAETFVRIPDVIIVNGIPNRTFYKITGIAVGLVMGIGAFVSIRNRKKWSQLDKSYTTEEKN